MIGAQKHLLVLKILICILAGVTKDLKPMPCINQWKYKNIKNYEAFNY